MASLTSRQEKRIAELGEKYASLMVSLPKEYVVGFTDGFKHAMRTMYPDAETMFSEDAQAADLVLTVLALESLK